MPDCLMKMPRPDRVHSTAWLVVVVMATFLQQVVTLSCHLCNAGEPSFFCNATSNVMTCDTSEQRAGCMVQVTNTGTSLTSWKTCHPADDCEADARSNSPLCEQGVVQGTCTYCCQENMCNYDRFAYSVTTPAPTTPTPATTVTSLSTIAPPTCSTGNLTSCVVNFRRYVNDTVYDPRGEFPEFCRAMPFVFLCVLDALEGCLHGDATTYTDTVKQVASALYTECPRQCSPISGVQCAQTVFETITETFMYGATPCRTVTLEYQHFQHCLTYSTGSCDVSTRARFQGAGSFCHSQVSWVCDAEHGSTAVVSPPGEASPCRARDALLVIAQLDLTIVQRLSNGGDLEDICSDHLEHAQASVTEHISQCEDAIKLRVEKLFEMTTDTLAPLCATPSPEPVCNVSTARQCVVDLWRLIDEAEDFTEVCKAIPRTRECAAVNTAACDEEEKQSIQTNLDLFINRVGDRCEDVVEVSTACNETITLTEGGDDYEIEFRIQRSPSDICGGRENCQVLVEAVVGQGEQPRCPEAAYVIDQIVFLNACGIDITDSNWQHSHSITISAKIDGTIDGDQMRTITLVMKIIIDGVVEELRTICEYQVVVIDKDTVNFCSSMNDPHLTTFDGHYYHNFFDGEFVLYRHDRLPYQVNMMYQRCQRSASCNCGVAVKSGDAVFIVEKCRKRRHVCPRDTTFCNGNQLRTRIFTHGHVTPPHMRIFSKDAGNGFDVLLPHGTMIKIRTGHKIKAYINVWVYPSAADWENTKGLCGFYDNATANDLRLPSGNTFRGGGRKRGQHARSYCKAWQVSTRDTLFLGAETAKFTPSVYCPCTSDGSSGNQVCSKNALVDTCDIDTSTEVSPEIFPTFDLDEEVLTQVRQRRDVTYQDQESFIESLDLDLDFEPPGEDLEFEGSWSEAAAASYCEDALKTERDWARKCLTVPGFNADLLMQNCIDDVMVTGSTDWTDAALEALKMQCLHTLEVNNAFRQTFEGRLLEQEIRNELCPLDCNGHGRCQQGTCVCDDGYVGLDCYFRSDVRPENLSLPEEGLCNTRASNCSVVVIFGKNFVASNSLTCHLQPVKVTESGMEVGASHVTVPGTHFSTNQVLCAAPSEGSHLVDVSNDGVATSGVQKLHLAHDPNCYSCSTGDDETTPRCIRTTNGCLVEGHCYKNGEENPTNPCYLCKSDKSRDGFSRQSSASCYVMEIVIAACIIVVLATIIIIICCCCCRKNKAKLHTESNDPAEKSAMFRSSYATRVEKPTELPSEQTGV